MAAVAFDGYQASLALQGEAPCFSPTEDITELREPAEETEHC